MYVCVFASLFVDFPYIDTQTDTKYAHMCIYIVKSQHKQQQ